MAKASANQVSYYNKGRTKIKYKVGDLVMRREHYLSLGVKNFAAKLAESFSGPYKVTQVLSPTVYQPTSETGDVIPKAHIRFLIKSILILMIMLIPKLVLQ